MPLKGVGVGCAGVGAIVVMGHGFQRVECQP
jgi:hypothetical protein